MNEIDRSGENGSMYEAYFKTLTNTQFKSFIEKLQSGVTLPIFRHNWKSKGITTENNLALAKKWGVNVFVRCAFEKDGNTYMPDIKYMVLPLPVRRTLQVLVKDINVPVDNKSRDLLSGQVTGKSKAHKLTHPEMVILDTVGLKNSLTELLTTRGGDLGLSRAMNTVIERNGKLHHNDIEPFGTGREITKNLKSFFKAAHISIAT